MMNEMRHMERQPVDDTKAYWMNVISFKRLDRTELIAKVVDMSPQGVGIEARNKVEPGFVWFSEKVDGSRGGLLMWSKQFGDRYRGGVKFLSLSKDDEERVQRKIDQTGPMGDASEIVEAILESLQNSGEDSHAEGLLEM